jgi:1-acyl-sn-glycerol-3-phosphate acyltransferase
MHNLRAGYNLLAITVWTLALLPFQLLGLAFGLRLASQLPQFYHRGNCAILGIKLERVGERLRQRPVLYAANHTSWIDIIVLSAVIPGSFVAKREVAGWPIAGTLAKLQRSVFVDRDRRRVAAHRDDMLGRHLAGDLLILFPEGTSNDGNRVLPFKSSFFAVAEKPINGQTLTVQPVSVAYTRLNYMPMGRHLRPYFAWYGDMELLPHLWRMLGIGPITVVVEFHRPVSIEDFASRKTLAAHCHAEVTAGVSRALAGRPTPQHPAPAGPAAEAGNLDTWGPNVSVSR